MNEPSEKSGVTELPSDYWATMLRKRGVQGPPEFTAALISAEAQEAAMEKAQRKINGAESQGVEAAFAEALGSTRWDGKLLRNYQAICHAMGRPYAEAEEMLKQTRRLAIHRARQ